MIPESPTQLDQPQRQSLWAVGFLALRTLRQVGIVQLILIVGFVFARVPSVAAFLGLAAVVGAGLFAIAALQWWRYTFQIVEDKLVVERGVLQKQTLSIPLDRVQSVSLEQKLLHRIIELVQVTLDTAGTLTAEFVIDAVDQRVAEDLQRAVANVAATSPVVDPAEVAAPPPPEQIVVHHPWRRVVLIALTQMPFAGLVLIGPLFAVGDDIARYLPFDPPEISEPTAGPWLLWFVPLLLIAGLGISMVLNLARVLLSDWNLTVRSTAAGIRRDAGLLSTTSVAATIPRIQLIRTRQGLLERLGSIRSVTLATFGASNISVPGCDVHQAADLRSLALAGSAGVQALDERVSSSQVFLDTRNTAVAAIVPALLLGLVIGWWSSLLLLMVPAVWWATRRTVRLRRWGLTSEALADRHELLGWRRDEVLIRKVNGVDVRQSLFERKRELATVKLHTAAGSVSIGMISLARAVEVRDHVLYCVETDRRAWM